MAPRTRGKASTFRREAEQQQSWYAHSHALANGCSAETSELARAQYAGQHVPWYAAIGHECHGGPCTIVALQVLPGHKLNQVPGRLRVLLLGDVAEWVSDAGNADQ